MRIEQTNASYQPLHTVAKDIGKVPSDSAVPVCSVKNQPSQASDVNVESQKAPSRYGHLVLLPCEMRHAVFEKLSIHDLAVLAKTSTALRADCVAVALSNDAPTLKAHWFEAARQNRTETIKLLLAAGFDRNTLDSDDRNAVYYAALKGNLEATVLLRDAAQDAEDMTTLDGKPGASRLLHYFAGWGDSTAVKTLVAAGCHPDSIDRGETALMAAIERKSPDCVRVLLDAGANANGANQRNAESPLSSAIQRGCNKIVEMLLAQPGIYLSNPDSGWLNPEARALRFSMYDKKQPNILAQIKEFDASRAHPEAKKWVKAAVAGDIATLSELNSRHGTSAIDAFSTRLSTALRYAAWHDHLDAVKALISWGANPSFHDGDGETALAVAAREGFTRVVEYLLEYPQDLDMLGAGGQGLLHHASREGRAEIVEMLIRAGANPNIQNVKELDTPLHYVARHGHTDMVKLLLRLGADPHAKNADGTTPLDRAHHSRSSETVAAFEAHLGSAGS